MKLLHLSDLHLGKRVHEFSMLDDQRHILSCLLTLARQEAIDGVLIAGDIYDKTIPPVEAVELLDDFLTELTISGFPVFLISGNHDSPERLRFGSRILQRGQVHIAAAYTGHLPIITLTDAFGPVDIHLMPFLRPSDVNRQLGTSCASYQEAVKKVLHASPLDPSRRNVLIAHQFVTHSGQPPQISDSEVPSLGGIDQVDASLFHAFDYVALGHIHKPQAMGRQELRYAGSPLKYSFSEAKHEKKATLIELSKKGEVHIHLFPLSPRRELLEWSGSLRALETRQCYTSAPKESYMHITLTDRAEMVDAIGKVREVYPHTMLLDFAATGTDPTIRQGSLTQEDIQQQTPLQLFSGFFESQTGSSLTDSQQALFARVVQEGTEKGGKRE